MPPSADLERKLLNHYKLTSLYPDSWPHSDNDSSDSDSHTQKNNFAAPTRHTSKLSLNSRSSLSKYRNIERHASIRSATATTSESLVQKDEPDPLGMAPSVATELKKRGLPVEDNLKLRNRFMLSSTSFSPQLFLSQVHQEASTEDLLRGLDYLSQSIEQKSASLKVLVESNFEKFVRAKATIDNVYKEMRDQGGESEQQQSGPRRPQSRHTSTRSQTHFRNTSGPFSPTAASTGENKKKNALTKESEYGVQGIKTPLVEVSIKAEEVWGPAFGGREKEETLKAVLSTVEQHRDIFRLSANLHESIRKNDYDGVVETFKQAKKYADQARNIATIAQASARNDVPLKLGEADAQQIIVTAKMWHDTQFQINGFKRNVWKKLRNASHGPKHLGVVTDELSDKEEHIHLIAILLQLGVDENPIWEWLHSRYLYLKDKIARSFERGRIEVEVMRRKLGNNEQRDVKMLAKYLRSVADASVSLRLSGRDSKEDIDTPAIIAFWEKVQTSITRLLSSQTGILGEVLEYWATAQSFIDNKAQKSFPTAVFASGLEHLELEPDDVANLRSGAVDLITLLRENVMAFFSDPPVEDLSELYSPIPPTPITPASSASLTPGGSKNPSFTFDPSTAPPPSTKRGDPWEKFAFWPPQANSLSGSHYLSRILVLVGTAASEMASLPAIKQQGAPKAGAEGLKLLVAAVRERCIQALCAAWNADAERCKYLETWTRTGELGGRDVTTMPSVFRGFEEEVMRGAQRMAYISAADDVKGRVDGGEGVGVISPPSAKLVQALRGTFVTSLYKALSGMVENAEMSKREGVDGGDPDGVVVVAKAAGTVDGEGVGVGVDGGDRNIHLLLTLSNLTHLRSETIPHLISQFESLFSIKLTDESKTLRDVLSQIDARLFQSYVKPTVEKLNKIINDGVTSPYWPPEGDLRPTDAKPYVYDVLLTLVLVHSEITTTAPPLTNPILSHCLEQCSLALITAFKTRAKYSLPALMQATLDVEFMAQTLNNYTTDRAGEVQSQIYLALDERTDNQARGALQKELPEMRGVLKRLREGTKGVYGCFKRERRGRAERAGSSRGQGG